MNNTIVYYIDIRGVDDSLNDYKEFETREEMLKVVNGNKLDDIVRYNTSLAYVGYGEKTINLKTLTKFDNDLKVKLAQLKAKLGINETAKQLKVTRQFIWLLAFNRIHYIKKTLAEKIRELEWYETI